MAAFHESPAHVVVEFLKSSGTDFGSRAIRLNHRKSAVPPQLFARVDPVGSTLWVGAACPDGRLLLTHMISTLTLQRLWATFMGEVEHLAANHPYVQQPGAGKVAGWAAGCAVGSVLGFCCIDPDGGDYGQWEGQLRELVDRYAGYFAQVGSPGGGIQPFCYVRLTPHDGGRCLCVSMLISTPPHVLMSQRSCCLQAGCSLSLHATQRRR